MLLQESPSYIVTNSQRQAFREKLLGGATRAEGSYFVMPKIQLTKSHSDLEPQK